MKRSIIKTIRARKVRMGDIYLDQPLPHPVLDSLDPYLLIHHWKQNYPGGQRQREVGVGPHPHRGFIPVTLIFEGGLHHRDSLGNNSIVKAGGTQWTSAGKGITHSERPMKSLAENGGTLELIQFWLNAPRARKMDPAVYHALSADNTPTFNNANGDASVGLVAGDYKDMKSPIPTQSEILIMRMEMKEGAVLDLEVPADYNALIYQLDGSLKNGDQDTRSRDMLVYENEGDIIRLEAAADTRAILLAGKPLNEPVVSHGPFVMNQDTEIMQAMRDYQMGKMGVLIEEFD